MRILPFEYIKSETCLETCGIPDKLPDVNPNSYPVARVTFQSNTRYVLPEVDNDLNSLGVYQRKRPGSDISFRIVTLVSGVQVTDLEQIDQVVLAFK